MKFINIGYGNMVAVDRIVTLVSPDSAPIKRLIQDAKDDGRVIDVTCGRKTRAVIVTDSEHVILAAIQTETIANRLENDGDLSMDDEDPEEGFDFGDEDSTIYEVECACGNIIDFDEETLEKGSIVCPNCGEVLEFTTEDED